RRHPGQGDRDHLAGRPDRDHRRTEGVKKKGDTPMLIIDRAGPGELPEVLRLLNEAAAWLRENSHSAGQWAYGFSADRVGPYVDLGEVWLVYDEADRAIATVRITPISDPDFWTLEEIATPALYISKLARDRQHSRSGLGALILRWVVDYAAQGGYELVRLD